MVGRGDDDYEETNKQYDGDDDDDGDDGDESSPVTPITVNMLAATAAKIVVGLQKNFIIFINIQIKSSY